MKKLLNSKLFVFMVVLMFLSVQCLSLFVTADSSIDGKIDDVKGDLAKMSAIDTSKDLNVTVLESDANRTVVKFNINNFNKSLVNIDNNDYYNITCDGTTLPLEAGAPELPRIVRNIAIPSDANVKVKVISSEYEDYKDFPIAPSKGSMTRDKDPKDVPYTFGETYKKGHYYPSELVTLSEPFLLREVRGTTITLNAFQYKAANKTLRVYTSVTVEIVNEGTSSVNSLTAGKATKYTKDFIPAYENAFINFSQVQSAQQSITRAAAESGSMLIICYDSYASSMTNFVNWKNTKGISTTLVNRSTVSSSNNATEIKNYIQNYYNANPNLAYVLLVGDYAQVSSPTYSDGVSDPTYGKVAGSDNYPDIYIGRFSAQSTTDVLTQVQRTIEFEQNGYNTYSWFKKGLGLASDESAGGESDIQHMNIIKNKLLGYNYTLVDSVYDPGATATSVANSVNAGRGVINYVGHGAETYWVTSGFSNTNIANLTNVGQLPFIVSVSCVSGRFQTGTCFAEAWLRSRNASGNPIGAIGALMSTVNQPWVPPMVGQDGIMDLLVAESYTSLGGLCYNGQTQMISNGTSDDLLTFHTWTLFGDPSIQVHASATPSGDTYEPNDTLANAYAVTSGTDYDSYIYTSTDVDYYKFTINTTGSITATLGNLPYDYDLYLYNSAGTQVASSTNGSTTSESITYSATSTGTYYLKVIGYNNVYSQTTKYRLKATYPTGSGGLQWYYETLTIQSPHNYTNNYNATNTYTKTGATKVQVHFAQFETEANYDYVYIKDKNNTTISTYHGTLSPFWATVDGDTIKISLVTDSSITKYGYRIDQVAYYANGVLVIEKVDIRGGNL